jgi:26S proteasome regulatory subunit N7
MSKRDFTGAAELLLDTLSTFTCTEMMDYKTFVKYAVLSGAYSLDRPLIKSKVNFVLWVL